MSRYEFLSVAEAADELGRARWFIYGLLDSHKLAYHKIGGRRMIARCDLDAYVERSRKAAHGEHKPQKEGAGAK